MNNLHRSHPILTVLEASALGGEPPTVAALDRLNACDPGMPTGEGLSRLRSAVDAAARRAANETVAHGYAAGRRAADQEAAQLADRMTKAQRGAVEPAGESSADISARMFSN